MIKEKSVKLNITLKPHIKEKLKKDALKKGMSISSYIIFLIGGGKNER